MKHVQEEIQKKGNALTALQQRVKELGSADSEVSARAIGKTIVDLVPIALGLAEGVSAAPEAAAVEAPAETVGSLDAIMKPAMEPLKPPPSALKEPGIVKQVLKGEKVAQPQAQEALREASAGPKILRERGYEDLARGYEGADIPLRELNTAPIKTLEAHADQIYQAVDKAAGTDIKALQTKLENTEYQLGQLTETPEDLAREATLTNSRQAILDKIAAAKQQATTKGISSGALDEADAAFKRAQALKELDTKVLKNPSIVQGSEAMGTPETVNVDSAIKVLQKMQDSKKFGGSRLEQALGKEGAEELLKKMYEAQRLGVKALSRQNMAKFIGGAVVKGGGIVGTIEAINLLSGK